MLDVLYVLSVEIMDSRTVVGRETRTLSAPVVVTVTTATATVVLPTPTAVFSGTDMEHTLPLSLSPLYSRTPMGTPVVEEWAKNVARLDLPK